MLLAIDIGNTFTKFGVYENDSLICRFNFPTVRTHHAADLFNPQLNQPIRAVIISSVVPELSESYRKFAENYFSVEPIFVDNSIDFGLKINYYPPENLGIDRLIAAFAAVEKYTSPVIVGDFGTATTIDVVNSKNEFLGGIITPGMRTMSESLFLKTSKLPQIEIEKPASVIGNSTAKAIQAGIYFGYIGLVDGIIGRMIGELGEKPKVVATGGFANLIAESSAAIEVTDDNLLLDGLRLIYETRFR